MDLSRLAEQRILEAQRNGAFDNLASDGKPLELGRPMTMEQRLYQTVLKNANVRPIEVELFKKRAELRAALGHIRDKTERAKLVSELAGVQTELDLRLGRLTARKRSGGRRLLAVKAGR